MLREHLDDFVMAYLDNILIYLKNKEEHIKHVTWVLGKLKEANLPLVLEKYKFYIKKTEFIEFIIKLEKLRIDLEKVYKIKI